MHIHVYIHTYRDAYIGYRAWLLVRPKGNEKTQIYTKNMHAMYRERYIYRYTYMHVCGLLSE